MLLFCGLLVRVFVYTKWRGLKTLHKLLSIKFVAVNVLKISVIRQAIMQQYKTVHVVNNTAEFCNGMT